MTRALYSLLMVLLQPWLRSKLRRRARQEPEYGQHIAERFGYYSNIAGAQGGATAVHGFVLWVHAVSLGETRAAAVLVDQLRLVLPGMRLLLTHGTATGRAQGRTLLRPGDVQVWQPWDTPEAVDRFLTHFQPHIGLLVETEVWPNMVAACAQRAMPLCLVNARMSVKSLAQAQRLGWLARPAYSSLHAVWAQAPEDAARLAQLGAPISAVLGNFKFDATPDAQQLQQGRAWHDGRACPVVVFANSRDGEEALFLQAIKDWLARSKTDCALKGNPAAATNRIQWLLVPRHPQRFDEVAHLCVAHGFSVSRRSGWGDAPGTADIWLGDSMGEMALYYALADVALLGGSFAPLGGHNLIEATACGCPVVMGPHTFNFAQAAQLALEAGAAFTQRDMVQAVALAASLACSHSDLARARAAATNLGAVHQGAARRTAQAVQQLLVGSAASHAP